MIQVWVDGEGFKKTVDGFKDLKKGDRFRTLEGIAEGPIMVAKGNPYRTVKNNRTVWVIKADFFDLEIDV